MASGVGSLTLAGPLSVVPLGKNQSLFIYDNHRDYNLLLLNVASDFKRRHRGREVKYKNFNLQYGYQQNSTFLISIRKKK
jgi:hypothetical protein